MRFARTRPGPGRTTTAVLALTVATLGLTACTSAEDDGPTAAPSEGAGEQVVQTPTGSPSGEGCTLEKYGATKIDLKDAIVGFSQSEPEAAAFRVAETKSIKDEAAKVGVKQLLTTNANNQLSKQIADIQDMLAKGAQFLIVAPLNSDGLQPALEAAKAKKVPVLTIDRKVNATACSDYVAFLGSDFVDQGRRAGEALIKETGGNANVAILLGASGNNVTTDRTQGFKDAVAGTPGIKIVAEQTGEFARDKGQAVMETMLQANPEIDAVYAENDEMGLGALVAIQAAGKVPGKDVRIFSIDGIRDAVQALADGRYNGVIESNPRFGPLAFKTAQDFLNGTPIPEDVIISDNEYTPENAAQQIGNAF